MSLFRRRVYDVVKKIPKGKVLTYKMVAKLAGSARAWRAVGNVLNENNNRRIPCHRVVRSDGRIGGYRFGAREKAFLLKKEGVIIEKGKLSLWK